MSLRWKKRNAYCNRLNGGRNIIQTIKSCNSIMIMHGHHAMSLSFSIEHTFLYALTVSFHSKSACWLNGKCLSNALAIQFILSLLCILLLPPISNIATCNTLTFTLIYLVVSLNMAAIYCDKCHTDIKVRSNNTVHLSSNRVDKNACSFFFKSQLGHEKCHSFFSGLSIGHFSNLVNLAVVSGATDNVNLQNGIKNFHWTLKLIFF